MLQVYPQNMVSTLASHQNKVAACLLQPSFCVDLISSAAQLKELNYAVIMERNKIKMVLSIEEHLNSILSVFFGIQRTGFSPKLISLVYWLPFGKDSRCFLSERFVRNCGYEYRGIASASIDEKEVFFGGRDILIFYLTTVK